MRKIALFALFLFTLTAVFTTTNSLAQNNWRDKVDDWVLETAVPANTQSTQNQTYPTTQFLVQLQAQADLSGADALATKEEKGRYVVEKLTAVANHTQPAVIQQLEELDVAYKPFWVANMIWVEGDIYAIQAMAQRSDVAHLYANPLITQEIQPPVTPLDTAGDPWDNIAYVGAKDVWALGYTGQGVVIGGQDTGYEWTHESLQPTYRGWNGSSADHNYNWHDAWNTAVGACPANSQAPCDDYGTGHGTHTMGTMAGVNGIGMAPGAKWIGCRNMTGGEGTPASYTDCYQWFIAPTDLNNANPDPTKAPDVINNSWSCPPGEGCNADTLTSVVAAVRAAGIVTVHSAGNSGPNCFTINTPAAIYDDSFTVGATNNNDQIASFSSRGWVTVDSSERMKPDIVAPGVSIYSAQLTNSYGYSNGTSMAAPHVAGLVALILSADPDLKGNVDAIEQIIQDTAVPLTTTQNCGSDTPVSVPNNVYGYGRIDALKAITQITLPLHFYLPLIQKN